jgi:hypothetical protein
MAWALVWDIALDMPLPSSQLDMLNVLIKKICVSFQTILSCRPEGDSKLQDLKRRGQSLCEHQDLEESRRREVQQTVRDMEEEWRRVLQTAEETLTKAEMQSAVEGQLRDLETQKENSRVWIKGQHQHLLSLGSQAKTENRIQTAQVSLQLMVDMVSVWVWATTGQRLGLELRLSFGLRLL